MFGIVASCYAMYSTISLMDPTVLDNDFNVSGILGRTFVPVKVL